MGTWKTCDVQGATDTAHVVVAAALQGGIDLSTRRRCTAKQSASSVRAWLLKWVLSDARCHVAILIRRRGTSVRDPRH
jgi:hypothetical protein